MKIKKILSVMLCVVVFTANTSVFSKSEIDLTNGETVHSFFLDVLKATQSNYRFDVTREELLNAAVKKVLTEHPEMLDEFLKGAYGALDENSRYLSEEEYKQTTEDVSGLFTGIGINVTENNGKVIVGNALKGSPAEEAGFASGDVIVGINDEDVKGYSMDKMISLIRGPEATYVKVDVERNDKVISFNVKRSLIKLNPVEYEALDKNNAGYVKIMSFNASTEENFAIALDELGKNGVDKIILDLRYNLGGYISEAVNIASHFVPDDLVVVTESYKNENRDIIHHARHTDKKFKVVVLVNEYSASASEIVSGAIKDYKLGVLVGKNTFGKGTVQSPTLLKNYGAIWLTIAQYKTPNGTNVHKVGIKPDYEISNTLKKVDLSQFEPVSINRKLELGYMGTDVLAMKQRLGAMGYSFRNIDGVFDDRMVDVIKDFQQKNELFSYGVADFTTQRKIAELAIASEYMFDNQLEKAKELIFEMK